MARKRDKNGRFIKGDSGGPGRPSKATERQYWTVAKTACTLDQWQVIITRAIQDASDGDRHARKWLSDLLVGNLFKMREREDASDAPAPAIESTTDIVKLLASELADVGRFPNDARRAALVGQLSARLLQAFEVSELAERLERIEAMLGEQGK